MNDSALSPLLVFFLGVCVGVALSTLVYVFWPSVQKWFYRTYQAFSDPYDLGFPFQHPQLIILVRNGYCLAFDQKFCVARWAVHKMSKFSITARLVEKRSSFLIDKDLPNSLQVLPSFYDKKPWDRGHLVPCEDLNYSPLSSKQTFLMSNIVPQDAKLNRRAWRSLEHNIRLWAEILGEIHVVTGVFIGKRPKKINAQVSIPRGFYKVIYSELVERAIAFYYPNEPLQARDLWQAEYVMSIKTLENRLQEGEGVEYRFFPLITGSLRNRVVNDCEIDYWLTLLNQRKKRR